MYVSILLFWCLIFMSCFKGRPTWFCSVISKCGAAPLAAGFAVRSPWTLITKHILLLYSTGIYCRQDISSSPSNFLVCCSQLHYLHKNAPTFHSYAVFDIIQIYMLFLSSSLVTSQNFVFVSGQLKCTWMAFSFPGHNWHVPTSTNFWALLFPNSRFFHFWLYFAW
jgi:hypothetical protein